MKFCLSGIAMMSLMLSACGSADENAQAGDTDAPGEKGFTDTFNAEWTKTFMSSCVPAAVNAGASNEIAQKGCSCAADELNASLDGMIERANPPQEKLEAAIEACRPE